MRYYIPNRIKSNSHCERRNGKKYGVSLGVSDNQQGSLKYAVLLFVEDQYQG